MQYSELKKLQVDCIALQVKNLYLIVMVNISQLKKQTLSMMMQLVKIRAFITHGII